ncbi:M48 family metallopeptidase [Picosynechococcus sp. PCC 7117]|uniref:M48 family metallopeptidase n=1 Tax=Picosynechococcus sp. PCC 7117 TaxID=195498 RepID=UPI000810727C|nr:SprT family zinc-dependent metalloprotease [Picosynechococcus sp. PCC 7117]ANV89129.1 hypothetical protein AWQ22_16195 [Picosynechococcus sp. PCC 7117]
MPKAPITEEKRQFSLYGETLPYLLKRGDRRTLQISIHPDKSIVVHASHKVALTDIDNLLAKRNRWIDKTLRKIDQLPAPPSKRQYISGEIHHYLGRQYRLNITQGESNSIKLQGGYFQIIVPDPANRDHIKALLQQWYKDHATLLFQRHLAECIKKTQHILDLGDRPINLKIRPMRTRWGSCSSRGNINLNLDLIQAPPSCIDYVIIHELCHFREMNHSKKFWRLLSQCLPDWEQRKQKLAQTELPKS